METSGTGTSALRLLTIIALLVKPSRASRSSTAAYRRPRGRVKAGPRGRVRGQEISVKDFHAQAAKLLRGEG
jgi:hypothetical protein